MTGRMPVQPRVGKRRASVLVLAVLLAAGALPSRAEISKSRPLDVRILLDNSGSMYPGYVPGSGQKRSQLGVRFFYQYPRFRAWVGDFVAQQKILNARSVSLAVLTSSDKFQPGDVKEIRSRVPLARFDIEAALTPENVPEFGRNTFLSEGLDEYTRGFEGLVWLITDNIVETGDGNPDAGVLGFFQTLKTTARYRSVHLFKLPFEDPDLGQKSDLAVYGILVSREKISDAKYFDRMFRNDFRRARSPKKGSSLFPNEEHLKLKDLSIDALRLRIPDPLDVDLGNQKRFFEEGENVPIRIPGIIHSNLTHHRITGGRYTLSFITPFLPDKTARDDYGIRPIPPEAFTSATRELDHAIPPNGSLRIDTVELDSRDRVKLEPAGFWAWVKLAAVGLRIEYSGTARMSFQGLRVELDREKMSGIFGVDKASKVFDFQDVRQIDVEPDEAPIRFSLSASGHRGFLLLILLAVVGSPFGIAVYFFQQRANYRVTIGTDPPTVVALRRLGSYRIFRSPHTLGRLERGLDGRHRFVPGRDVGEVQAVSASRPGSYGVTMLDGEGLSFSIEPLEEESRTARASGRRFRRPGAAAAAPVAGPVRSPPRTGRPASPSAPSPGNRKPRIRRPGR